MHLRKLRIGGDAVLDYGLSNEASQHDARSDRARHDTGGEQPLAAEPVSLVVVDGTEIVEGVGLCQLHAAVCGIDIARPVVQRSSFAGVLRVSGIKGQGRQDGDE